MWISSIAVRIKLTFCNVPSSVTYIVILHFFSTFSEKYANRQFSFEPDFILDYKIYICIPQVNILLTSQTLVFIVTIHGLAD